MSITWKAATAGVSAALLGAFGLASLAVADPASTPSPTQVAVSPASASLSHDLQYMREEERLARDVYAALAAHYGGARPFANITKSEQRHFDEMGVLLVRYGVSDPSSGLAAGDYAFDDLDEFYAKLVASGKTSLAAAYQAGVDIEKHDIADLEQAIARTSQADAKQAFERLLAGSQNHLRAFQRTPGQTGTMQGQQGGDQAGQGMRGNGNQAGRGQQNRATPTPAADCPHR